MLNEVVLRANTNLIIKIGGCEAVRDIEQCKLLGSQGIMAPMIGTSFAMQKFKGAAALKYGDELDSVEWIINAETITCYQNFDEILQTGKGFINTVVVGKSDLSASMGVNRDEIDKDIMLVKVLDFAKKSKRLGIKASFGGGVSIDTIPFIMKLEENIDQYETKAVKQPRTLTITYLKSGKTLAISLCLCYLVHMTNRVYADDAVPIGIIYAVSAHGFKAFRLRFNLLFYMAGTGGRHRVIFPSGRKREETKW